ncbi:recombinase family protein [Saccharopolyspora erythraea]|uniref:recombinase family protein n=1 Tax=Saccharopolyspora erythraea TaxID=1836 RepID=UPI001BA53782|nr:recombinase family protein [Saccharopolyspora erythraea]QUG99894.1 recombinase family protein [Saccharopolyspora erythraea]
MIGSAGVNSGTAAQYSTVRLGPGRGAVVKATGRGAAVHVRLSRDTDESTSTNGSMTPARPSVRHVAGPSQRSRKTSSKLQPILARLDDIDVIDFFKIDRLVRSTVDFAEIMARAEAKNVALASTRSSGARSVQVVSGQCSALMISGSPAR